MGYIFMFAEDRSLVFCKDNRRSSDSSERTDRETGDRTSGAGRRTALVSGVWLQACSLPKGLVPELLCLTILWQAILRQARLSGSREEPMVRLLNTRPPNRTLGATICAAVAVRGAYACPFL